MLNSVTSSHSYRDIRIHCVAYSVVTLLAIGLIILGTQSGQIQGLNSINSQIIIGSGSAVLAIELAIIYLRNNTNLNENQSQTTAQADKNPLETTNYGLEDLTSSHLASQADKSPLETTISVPFDGLKYYQKPLNAKQVAKIKDVILLGQGQHLLYFDEHGVESIIFTHTWEDIEKRGESEEPQIMPYADSRYDLNNDDAIHDEIIEEALALPETQVTQEFAEDEDDKLQPYLRDSEKIIYRSYDGDQCFMTKELDLMFGHDDSQIYSIQDTYIAVTKAVLDCRYKNAEKSGLTENFQPDEDEPGVEEVDE